MHSLASRYRRRSLVGVIALAGCVSVQPAASRRPDDAQTRYQRVLDSVAVASSLEGDEVATAPRIRLIVPPATYASTSYLEASFHLSEDAYVLVAVVDLDRRVRVLYPESPDQSGFAAKSNRNRLSRFFAGFGGSRWGSVSRYDVTQRNSPFSGEGVLLAVASDRPLQLERLIDADGDWDEHEFAQLLFDQSLGSAAHSLARAVVLTGQEYNTDYTTFNGGRTGSAHGTFAWNSFGGCGYGFGSFGGYAGDDGIGTAFVGFYERGGRTYARYAQGGASCGRPIYYDVPVYSLPRPIPPVDTTSHDSTAATPRHRVPGAPRLPSVTSENVATPVSRRLAAPRPGAGADGRPHPPIVAGLRFRQLRPTERQPSEGRPEPRSQPERLERPPEPVRQEPRQESRQEPRQEPVRSEPVRSQPVQRVPGHREPVTSPTPADPR